MSLCKTFMSWKIINCSTSFIIKPISIISGLRFMKKFN